MMDEKLSPVAAEAGLANMDWKELSKAPAGRKTDCPEGCVIAANAICAHGYRSAARTAYIADFNKRQESK